MINLDKCRNGETGAGIAHDSVHNFACADTDCPAVVALFGDQFIIGVDDFRVQITPGLRIRFRADFFIYVL